MLSESEFKVTRYRMLSAVSPFSPITSIDFRVKSFLKMSRSLGLDSSSLSTAAYPNCLRTVKRNRSKGKLFRPAPRSQMFKLKPMLEWGSPKFVCLPSDAEISFMDSNEMHFFGNVFHKTKTFISIHEFSSSLCGAFFTRNPKIHLKVN